jgi:hypothetical protein
MNLHGKHPHPTWTHPRARFHLNWRGRDKTKIWKVCKEGVLTKGLELEIKLPLVFAFEKCATWHSSQSFAKNHYRCFSLLVSYNQLHHPKGGGKDTIVRTTRLNVRQPHQVGHKPNDLREHKNTTTFSPQG